MTPRRIVAVGATSIIVFVVAAVIWWFALYFGLSRFTHWMHMSPNVALATSAVYRRSLALLPPLLVALVWAGFALVRGRRGSET